MWPRISLTSNQRMLCSDSPQVFTAVRIASSMLVGEEPTTSVFFVNVVAHLSQHLRGFVIAELPGILSRTGRRIQVRGMLGQTHSRGGLARVRYCRTGGIPRRLSDDRCLPPDDCGAVVEKPSTAASLYDDLLHMSHTPLLGNGHEYRTQ